MRVCIIAALRQTRREDFYGLVMRVISEWAIEAVAKIRVQQGLRTLVLDIQRFRYKAFSVSPLRLLG